MKKLIVRSMSHLLVGLSAFILTSVAQAQSISRVSAGDNIPGCRTAAHHGLVRVSSSFIDDFFYSEVESGLLKEAIKKGGNAVTHVTAHRIPESSVYFMGNAVTLDCK